MKLKLPLFFIFFLTITTCFAQSQWLWGAAGRSGGIHPDCEGVALAIDHSNSTYLTGNFSDSLYIGTNEFYNAPGQALIMKCDSSGNIVWAQQGISSGFTAGRGIASDYKGNIYCVGEFATNAVFGAFTLSSSTIYVATYLVKYNTNGTVLWARQSGYNNSLSNNDAFSQNVTTDKEGNVYIMGSFKDTIQFGNVKLVTPGNAMYIAKFDSSGNFIWATQSNGATATISALNTMSLTTDALNNVYLTFQFTDNISLGSQSFSSLNNSAIIAKLDSTGNVTWAKQITSGGSIATNSIIVGYDGDLYLTGKYSDSLKYGAFKIYSPSYPHSDMYIMKMDTAGDLTWCKTSSGLSNIDCVGYTVRMDSAYNIYISAGTPEDNPDTVVFDSVKLGSPLNDSPDGSSIILKLDSAGNYLCSTVIPAGGDDVNVLAVSPSGKEVFLGGDLYNAIRFGSDSILYYGSEVPFIARWQPCAVPCNIAVTTSPNTTICSGQSVPLIAGGASDYTWSPALGLNTTSGNNVTATPLVTTTYHISASTGSCSAIDSVVINVNPTPNVNVSSPTVCSGNLATLLASGATSYTWQPATGLNTTTGDSVVANITTTTTYTVIGSSANCFDTVTSVVTINPAPNKPTFTQHGDTLKSSATNDNQWYYNNTPLNNQTSQYLVIDTSGWYYVEVYNEANGCGTASDSVYINLSGIDPAPNDNSVGQELSIYPNPTSNQLTVETGQVINEITITNVLGQTVFMTAVPLSPFFDGEGLRVRLDVSNLPDGMYFITVDTDTGTATTKFIVNR